MLGKLGITGEEVAEACFKTLHWCHLEISKTMKTSDRIDRVATHTLRLES
jgi:hypothetical protein